MFESCLQKQKKIEEEFSLISDSEEKYIKIISYANLSKPYPKTYLKESNLVRGCQSKLYLYSEIISGKIYFFIESDALISKGMASLLVSVYDGEPPESLFKCPPTFLETIGLFSALSMNRSNGLKSLFDSMQRAALSHLSSL